MLLKSIIFTNFFNKKTGIKLEKFCISLAKGMTK